MKLRTLMLAAGVAGMTAACTQSPTAARRVAGPSYDVGLMYGSGNRASETTLSAGASMTADSLQAAVVASGLMYGSGN